MVDIKLNTKAFVIVNKIGLSREIASWIISITEKHHIWIANQIKESPELYNNNKVDFETIVNWKKEEQNFNLNKLSFKEAIDLSNDFFSKEKDFILDYRSLENKKVYLDLGDYKWVKLETSYDCQEEGNEMGHCLYDYDVHHKIVINKYEAYSLRDRNNQPHVTLDIRVSNGRIENIFGNSNSIVKDCYIDYLINFLEHNELWRKIKISHAEENVARTLIKVLLNSISDKKRHLVQKIIKASNGSLRFKIGQYISQCAGLKESHEDFYVKSILKLNRKRLRLWFWRLGKDDFNTVFKLIKNKTKELEKERSRKENINRIREEEWKKRKEEWKKRKELGVKRERDRFFDGFNGYGGY